MKSMNKSFLGASIILAVLSGCASKQAQQPELTLSGLNPANFEVSAENAKPIKLYTLKNSQGMEVCVTNFGGRIVSVMVPDKNGKMTDVVLGFDSIADYQNIPSDFGASIGRYANRINKGKITIDGQEIQLPTNNFGHCLHGGPTGWQYQVYEANQANDSTIVLTMKSPDGDNNFPGNVTANVTYSLTADNAIDIKYDATTDKTTVINMTNHSYFNLNGEGSGDVLDQELCIHAKYFTPVKDSQSIPTGEYAPVAGTPMDFNVSKPIGRDIEADFEQLKFTGGYDHNYVTDNYAKGNVRSIATAYCKESGIGMEVSSDCPCVQFYAGNFVKDEKGKNGHVYHERYGFCLETQVEPNAVNVEDFHSPILLPGEEYSSETVYRFFVK